VDLATRRSGGRREHRAHRKAPRRLQASESLALRERTERLRGVLTWRLITGIRRLTAAYAHLKELNANVEELTRQYDSFVRTRQAATHSYAGYDARMERLRGASAMRCSAWLLMDQQGKIIETVAINQLQPAGIAWWPRRRGALRGRGRYDRAARAEPAARER